MLVCWKGFQKPKVRPSLAKNTTGSRLKWPSAYLTPLCRYFTVIDRLVASVERIQTSQLAVTYVGSVVGGFAVGRSDGGTKSVRKQHRALEASEVEDRPWRDHHKQNHERQGEPSDGATPVTPVDRQNDRKNDQRKDENLLGPCHRHDSAHAAENGRPSNRGTGRGTVDQEDKERDFRQQQSTSDSSARS